MSATMLARAAVPAPAGASVQFRRLAERAANLYPPLGRRNAAGDAALRVAGGRVRAMDGTDLRHGERDRSDDGDFANPRFMAHGGFDPFAAKELA